MNQKSNVTYKKVLSLLLAFTLILGQVPFVFATGDEDNHIYETPAAYEVQAEVFEEIVDDEEVEMRGLSEPIAAHSVVTASTWEQIRQAVTAAGATPTTINIDVPTISLGAANAITIGANQNITILNGQSGAGSEVLIVRDGGGGALSGDVAGRHFVVNGTLNLGSVGGTPQSNHLTFYNTTLLLAGSGGVGDAQRSGGFHLNHANAHLSIHEGVVFRHLLSGNNGGAVNILQGTFTMHGGILEDNYADAHEGGAAGNGGAVNVQGANSRFIMYNGIIRRNRVSIPNSNANTNGGGVAVANGATFTMNGGVISDNILGSRVAIGGGVWVANSPNTTFNMNAGVIERNRAVTNGAGIWVGTNARFNMRTGTIRHNDLTGPDANGGGIFTQDETHGNLNIGHVDGNDTSNQIHFYGNTSAAHNGSPLLINLGVIAGRNNFPNIRWDNWLNAHHTATTSIPGIPLHIINNWDINTGLQPYQIIRILTMVNYGTDAQMRSESGVFPLTTTGNELFMLPGDNTVTLNPGTRSGFTFSHWVTSPAVAGINHATNVASVDITMPYANVVATAYWTREITFDLGGGHIDGDTSNPIIELSEFDIIGDLQPADPERAGHEFGGWELPDGRIVLPGEAFPDDIPEGSFTVTAIWIRVVIHTVTFHAAGGTDAPDPIEVEDGYTIGDQFPTEEEAPRRDGFRFMGWRTGANGAGIPVDADFVVTSNIVLFAQWQQIPRLTVIFDLQGGTIAGNLANVTRTVLEGYSIGEESMPILDVRQGFDLELGALRWNTEPDGSGEWIDGNSIINYDLTVYAIWRQTGLILSHNAIAMRRGQNVNNFRVDTPSGGAVTAVSSAPASMTVSPSQSILFNVQGIRAGSFFITITYTPASGAAAITMTVPVTVTN